MMHKTMAFPGLMLPVLLLLGCDPGPAPEAAVAAVDTVDGTARLRYAAAGQGSADWSTDTIAVIGDPFAEDPYQFDEVSEEGITGDAEGNVYVLDRQGARVLKYSSDGHHVATFGRKGEGPGELDQPVGLALGPADTVWVSDFSNSRLTGFPQDGGAPRTVAFAEGSGIPSPRMAVREGAFVLQFRPIFAFGRGAGGAFRMSRGTDGDAEESGPLTLPVLVLGPSLEPLDTLWETPEPPMDMVQLETAGRLMVTMMSREFHPEFQWAAFSDGGLVLSDSAAYVLHLLDASGAPRLVIERDPAPRPATEADREAARQRVREAAGSGMGVRMGGGGPDSEAADKLLQQRIEKMTFAERIPRVVELRVDPQDRIWVGVSEETADAVDRIDIYDRAGRLLAELREFDMPDAFLGSDHVATLRRDDLDVQQVVVLRVTESGSSAVGAL